MFEGGLVYISNVQVSLHCFANVGMIGIVFVVVFGVGRRILRVCVMGRWRGRVSLLRFSLFKFLFT